MKKPRQEESYFLYHTACIGCNSTDAMAVHSDGHGYCHSCESYFPSSQLDGKIDESSSVEVKESKRQSLSFLTGEVGELKKRGLTLQTCQKFGYEKSTNRGKPVQIATYYNNKGEPILQKLRYPNKEFKIRGDMKKAKYPLYGQHLWRDTGRMVVVTEGEIDAMSVSQIQGNKYPVVSIPNGAKAAYRAIKSNLEWLGGFDNIVLLFDNDEAGIEAAYKCAELLPMGKAKIASLPLKDANEMLLAGREDEVIDAIWGAKLYKPDGIVSGEEIWEFIQSYDTHGTAFPFTEKLNEKTRGMRRPEIILLTAGTGSGKSLVAREIAYYLRTELDEPVGYLALEESIGRTAINFMGFRVGKVLHVDKSLANDIELRESFDALFLDKPFYLYNHFGSTDMENITTKIRQLANGLDCRYIFLDHISIVISGSDSDNERKDIDRLMTRLRTLVEELNITLITICHVNKSGHENGKAVSLQDLRGSAGLAQLSDTIISLERNQQAETLEERNRSTLRVLKCRITGDTGEAGEVDYITETGRLLEVKDDYTNVDSDEDEFFSEDDEDEADDDDFETDEEDED